MLNSKNNPIPILNPRRQLILGGFDLLTIALTPKGKPSGLKDYNNLNEVDIDNILISPLLTTQLRINKLKGYYLLRSRYETLRLF